MRMKKTRKQASPIQYKNDVRFRLLVALPSFQEDVRAVRKEMGIPLEGFSNHEDRRKWHHNLIVETDRVMDAPAFLKSERDMFAIRHPQKRMERRDELYRTAPLYKMGYLKRQLGEKYRLPEHFIADNPLQGLQIYIETGIVRAPSGNWSITMNPEARKGTAKWLALTTYAPLSKKELNEAKKMLEDMQRHYLLPQVVVATRTKKQFERDLEIFREFIKRESKPVRRKSYEPQTYLSILASKGHPEKKLRALERKREYKKSIKIQFDERTSAAIGKQFHISADAARKAAERVGNMIADLFGAEFRPDTKRFR
jgi:hypothetical protein